MEGLALPERMPGCRGRLDYFVVAKRGAIRLGVRPLCFLPEDIAPLIGCRLRSAWITPPAGPVAPRLLLQAWSALQFHKADAQRASTVWLLDLPKMGSTTLRQTLIEQGFAARLAGYLLSCCGDDCDWVIPHAVLATLIGESWFGMLDALTAEGADIAPMADGPPQIGRDGY